MNKTTAQQMTDHEFTSAIDSKVAREMTSSALTFATDEALRARSEAARLLEENRKYAETTKALADALERRCAEHRKGCDCGGCAALRLAGRLK